MESDTTLWGCTSSVTNLHGYAGGTAINIEEGLSRPGDDNVFLSASMAFLQQRLLRKIETDIRSRERRRLPLQPAKRYSDLLMLNSRADDTAVIYVKLKNVGRSEEVMKSEASIPRKKLSLEQMLPGIREGPPTRKMSLLSLFVKKSATCTISPPVSKASSFSLFNLFKRSSKYTHGSDATGEDEETTTGTAAVLPVGDGKNELIQKYLQSIPSDTSCLTSSGYELTPEESAAAIYSRNLAIFNASVSQLQIPLYITYCRRGEYCEYDKDHEEKMAYRRKERRERKEREQRYKARALTKDEEDILRVIPESPFKIARGSKSENFRPYTPYKPNSSKTKTKFNVCETCVDGGNRGGRPKGQTSKLSVYLEGQSETEEEDGALVRHNVNSSVLYNFPEEIKSNMTPEILKDIIRRLVEDMQQKSA